MEPAVRGPGPQSGITPTRLRHLELRWLENRNCGCERGPNSRPNLDAGNGILGCGDRVPKAPAQTSHCAQRPKSGNWMSESPRRNALFSVLPEICGLRGLVGGDTGLELETYHPVIEPVSTCAGNGLFLRGDRPAKAGPTASRDQIRDAPEARKPRFPRTNCGSTCEGPMAPVIKSRNSARSP